MTKYDDQYVSAFNEACDRAGVEADFDLHNCLIEAGFTLTFEDPRMAKIHRIIADPNNEAFSLTDDQFWDIYGGSLEENAIAVADALVKGGYIK